MRSIWRNVSLAALCLPMAVAGERVFNILSGPGAMNHWPGPDGVIGSADDVVSDALSPLNGSAPNGEGSYGYNAFDFGGPGEETLLPPGRNAVTFIRGTVTLDGAVAAGGAGPLLLGWDVSGTEPFPFHGAYSATIDAVSQGSYDAGAHHFSQTVDFQANLVAGVAPAKDFVLEGDAYVVESADYGTPTGNAYVDAVLIPLAQAAGAKALFFGHVSGIIPQSDPGDPGAGFPEMPFTAALVGLELSGGAEPPQFTDIQLEPDGVRLTWNATAGTSYTLEATADLNDPFQAVATGLPGPEHKDPVDPGSGRRFYRLLQE